MRHNKKLKGNIFLMNKQFKLTVTSQVANENSFLICNIIGSCHARFCYGKRKALFMRVKHKVQYFSRACRGQERSKVDATIKVVNTRSPMNTDEVKPLLRLFGSSLSKPIPHLALDSRSQSIACRLAYEFHYHLCACFPQQKMVSCF